MEQTQTPVRKQRILSGIQPTGTPTLGNYIGAMRNWKLLEDEYDCLYMVADLHTITVRQEPAKFRQNAMQMLGLLLAFLPAAVIGLLCGDWIDAMLENVWVVATMLVLGGIFMLFVDKLFNHPDKSQEITEKKALAIGFFQCIAMIPGVSRSMATIVGGMAQRLSRKTAAEFSFFLAVPTMFAATAYKVLKLFLAPNGMEVLSENITALVVGNVVAFVVALLAIKFFIGFVTRYGFKAFGYYRIVVGGLILVMLFLGYNLQIV